MALLVFPGDVLLWFEDDSYTHKQFAIYLGTALIGFSVTNWLYSRFDDLSAVLPAIYGNLTSLAVAAIIDLTAIATNFSSIVMWLILVLHCFFAAAFIYCVIVIKRHDTI